MELRPLDLAGLLSRAATIYARDAGSFIAMVLTAIVPLTVLQYFITIKEQPQLDATIAWLQQSQYAPSRPLPPIFTSPEILLFALASVVLDYVIVALPVAAIGAAVAARNRNATVSYGSCMLIAVRRWREIIAVVVAVLLLGAGSAAAVTGAIVAPVAVVGAFSPAALFTVVAFGSLSILVALCLVFTMLLVVGADALYAVTLENCSPLEAVSRTLRRTCNRREVGRALVYSSVVSTIAFAVTTCADTVGFALLQHRPLLYVPLDALGRVAVLPFVAITFAVYYFDVRVRQEGYDLHVHVERLAAASSTGAAPTDAAHVAENAIPYAPTRYLSGEERALVASFMERRESLGQPYRRELAARIAGPVRARVPNDLSSMDDEALLERL